jgi:pyruvate formate lyase activating enzyme
MNSPNDVAAWQKPAADTPPDLDARGLDVGGLIPFSAVDYPGQMAAVVFVQGCPWRCRYCQNTHLQTRPAPAPHSWRSVLTQLERRVGLLDAVVFSGGEPTIDAALPAAIEQVRRLGFRVGLHTACISPQRLGALLPRLDWVGFDIKAPFARYASVTGVPGSGERARRCAELILASGVAYECRTTVHPALLSPQDLLDMARELANMGVRHYVLQRFRAQGCADASLNDSMGAAPYPDEQTIAALRPLFERFMLRGDT